MPYMVTFTINIPPMLVYIPAPWILWGFTNLLAGSPRAPRQGPGTSHLHHPGWLNGQQDQHFHRWRWLKAWYTADHPKETCQKSQRRFNEFNGCNFGTYDTPKSPCYVQKKDHSTLRKQSCNRTETKHKRQVILQGIISKFAHKLAPCFITLNLYQWD